MGTKDSGFGESRGFGEYPEAEEYGGSTGEGGAGDEKGFKGRVRVRVLEGEKSVGGYGRGDLGLWVWERRERDGRERWVERDGGVGVGEREGERIGVERDGGYFRGGDGEGSREL